ncbi:MAG TPA: hypothetical protein VNT03_03505 [Baekduia sp.]|nr:hypothetical protein [Baekduia sp.]
MAEGDPQADVGVAQRVRRQALGRRRQTGLLEALVSELDGLVEDALAGVVARPHAAGASSEDLVVGSGVRRAGLALGQLVAQRGHERHPAHAGVGLRAGDAQPATGEVDVAPAQAEGLADAQAAEDQRGEHGPAQAGVAVGAVVRLRVELRGRGEQRLDLLGAVKVGAAHAADLELAVARVHADGVAGDQLALVGDVEDRPEPRDGRVDVGRRHAASRSLNSR